MLPHLLLHRLVEAEITNSHLLNIRLAELYDLLRGIPYLFNRCHEDLHSSDI